MNVKELIKELKQYPPNMEVVRIASFEVDEQGNHPTQELSGVIVQHYYDDQFGIKHEEALVIY